MYKEVVVVTRGEMVLLMLALLGRGEIYQHREGRCLQSISTPPPAQSTVVNSEITQTSESPAVRALVGPTMQNWLYADSLKRKERLVR